MHESVSATARRWLSRTPGRAAPFVVRSTLPRTLKVSTASGAMPSALSTTLPGNG